MADLCGAHAALRIVFWQRSGNITLMKTQNTKTKPTAARNIQAIWSNTRSVNSNKPLPNAHLMHKEHYAADRATD